MIGCTNSAISLIFASGSEINLGLGMFFGAMIETTGIFGIDFMNWLCRIGLMNWLCGIGCMNRLTKEAGGIMGNDGFAIGPAATGAAETNGGSTGATATLGRTGFISDRSTGNGSGFFRGVSLFAVNLFLKK